MAATRSESKHTKTKKTDVESSSSVVTPASLSELSTLLNRQTLVCVEFSATWCGPCKAFAPIYEKLAQEYTGWCTMVKIDADTTDFKEFADQHDVRSLPTFLLFLDGKPVKRHCGAQKTTAPDRIRTMILDHISKLSPRTNPRTNPTQ